MSGKTTRILVMGGLALTVLAAGGFWGWKIREDQLSLPRAVDTLHQALQDRNAPVVHAHVDYTSLKASLASELEVLMVNTLADQAPADQRQAFQQSLSNTIAQARMEAMLDRFVSQQGMELLLRQESASDGPMTWLEPPMTIEPVERTGDHTGSMRLTKEGWQFVLRFQREPERLQWRLVGIELPDRAP